MAGHPVKVYIYDISKGLARNLSMAFLGKQIDGVWHTGIVVYGQEYYFGGGGIESCPPMGTILGQPDSIHDLGTTQVPQEVFMDYLREQATSSFRPQCYHLLEHNCNTFSSEVSQFLTGRDIPTHITNLPAEVMSTPFGQMLKPLVDSMTVTPEGGSRLFSQGEVPGESKAPAGAQGQTQPKDKAASSTSSNSSHEPKIKPDVLEREPVVFTTTVQEVLDGSKMTREALKSELPSQSVGLTEAVMDFLMSAEGCLSSLAPEHVQTLGDILLTAASSDSARQVVSGLLQQVPLTPGGLQALTSDTHHTLPRLIQSHNNLPPHLLPALLKTVVNCSSCKSGHQFLTSQALVNEQKVTSTILQLTTALCVSCLLDEQPNVWVVAASAVTNLLFYGVNADTSVELASAVLHCLTRELSEKTANLLLWSIVKMMRTSEEVRALTGVMGVDWDQFSSLSSSCRKLTQEARRMLSPQH